MAELATLFPPSYEASRTRFRQNLSRVSSRWPNAQLAFHDLDGEADLTIDWIWAEALKRSERLLLLTAGEHGVESYVGSAMHQLFIERYLRLLDPETTGLLLVHSINPWGMAHRRRANRHNVDLNRNFLWDLQELDPAFNPAYAELDAFLNPAKPARGGWLSLATFAWHYLRALLSHGSRSFWESKRLGQYAFPRGLHYGGSAIQEETGVLMRLYREAFELAPQVLHLDMHTGYGPRYQMSLVNSALEPRSSDELAIRFGYPLVVAATGEEFYAMRGDMIDYVYRLRNEAYPAIRQYATAFEFGTLGAGWLAMLRGLRAQIRENQLYWHGPSDPALWDEVQREHLELFAPPQESWRAKAVADADRAFQGILAAEGFLVPDTPGREAGRSGP